MKVAVIFAAGQGKRLNPLTKKTHKSLIKINGTPLIEHLINNLLQLKTLKEIIIITGYKHEKFLYLQDKYQNLKIIFNENYWQYQSAFALTLLPKEILNNDLFLISGDFVMKTNCFNDNINDNVMAAMERTSDKEDWSYQLNIKGNIIDIIQSNNLDSLLASEWVHITHQWAAQIANHLTNSDELTILKTTMIGKYLINRSIKDQIFLKPYLIDYHNFWDLDDKTDLARIKKEFHS